MRSASSWSRRRRRIELVRQARLPRAAGPGDSQHRHAPAPRLRVERHDQLRVGVAVLEGGDEPRERAPRRVAVAGDLLERPRGMQRRVGVAAPHDLADHAVQAHALPVLRAVDPCDAVGLQLPDLRGHDDAAASAEHLDVLAAALPERVDDVLEVLEVAALVRADGDALRVLLQRRGDDLVDRAVVPEVDHLGPHVHQDPPHDVDRCVVAVEQRRGGDDADLVLRPILGEGCERCVRVGHGVPRARDSSRAGPVRRCPVRPRRLTLSGIARAAGPLTRSALQLDEVFLEELALAPVGRRGGAASRSGRARSLRILPEMVFGSSAISIRRMRLYGASVARGCA